MSFFGKIGLNVLGRRKKYTWSYDFLESPPNHEINMAKIKFLRRTLEFNKNKSKMDIILDASF